MCASSKVATWAAMWAVGLILKFNTQGAILLLNVIHVVIYHAVPLCSSVV